MRKMILAASVMLAINTMAVPVTAENVKPDGAPETASVYVYLTDTETGQVIWSQNSEDPMFPASMTKMMTEILAIEAIGDLNERIPITAEIMEGLYEANAAVAGFQIGDEPTVRDLLYGTALASGAECVNALAIRTDGSVSAFVDHMNRKASELGMNDTHFMNPTGLHDPGHYSTCRDIGKLMAYCLRNDVFMELLQAKMYVSSPVVSAPDGLIMNSTVWSQTEEYPVPGLIGGKTGFTYPAGRCLASNASINGMNLILVTGKAPAAASSAIADAGTVYGWVRDHMGKRQLVSEGETFARIPVYDAKTELLTVSSDEAFVWDVMTDQEIRVETDFPEELYAPLEAGEYLGTVSVYEGNDVLYQKEYYIQESVSFSRIRRIQRALKEAWEEHPAMTAGGAALILLVMIGLKPKKNRKRRRKSTKRKTVR